MQLLGDLGRLWRASMVLVTFCLFNVFSLPALSQSNYQDDSELSGEYNKAYYMLDTLNAGLPTLEQAMDRQTPQAVVMSFFDAIDDKDYALAAHALNLNQIPQAEQATVGAALSEKLAYLLRDKGVVDFKQLSDRPDAQIESLPGAKQPLAGQIQRSVVLGEMDLRQYKQKMRLQRVLVGEAAPVWVFSASTVAHIERLYDLHGPSKIEKMMPKPLKYELFTIAVWEYILVVVLLMVALFLGRIISTVIKKMAGYLHGGAFESLLRNLTRPMTFTIALGLLYGLTSGLIFGNEAIASGLRPIMWIAFVFSAIWLGTQIIDFFAGRYKGSRINPLDDDMAATYRRRMTYLSIGRRVFTFILIMVGIAITLSEFVNMKLVGTTLLTSAGLAGAIIGIAAQPLIGNIIAGVQVAITKPIRIGDTVVIHDQWGTIEDLTYTYAVITTWDERRLITPMRDLVTEPLYNWTHTDRHMLRPVYLFVDYMADFKQLRQHFIALVKEHDDWCGESEPDVYVVDCDDSCVKLRGQLSANTPSKAWAMAQEIREKMIEFIREEHPAWLPRERFAKAATAHDAAPSEQQSKPRN